MAVANRTILSDVCHSRPTCVKTIKLVVNQRVLKCDKNDVGCM